MVQADERGLDSSSETCTRGQVMLAGLLSAANGPVGFLKPHVPKGLFGSSSDIGT